MPDNGAENSNCHGNTLKLRSTGDNHDLYIPGLDFSKNKDNVSKIFKNKAEFTPKTVQTKDERANLVYAIKINVKNDGSLKIGMYGEVLLN